MTVFEYDGRLLIVDCGVLFPETEQPGVDLILPDFDYIRDRLDDIEAIVLTHGHEDHIGAVPYLLRERPDIPLIGSRLTLALLEAKLAEHRIKPVTARGGGGRAAAASARSTASSSRSTTRSRTRWRSPSAPRPGSCCTPATSRWTSCRSTAGSPTSAGSPGSAPRASTCCCRTPPTPRSPASSPASARSAPVLDDVFRARGQARSSSPASPPTSTASSRSSTPPRRTAARSPSSAGRWSATWASPATSATCGCPPGLVVDARRRSTTCPPSRSCWSRTGSQGEPMSALSRMASRDHPIRIERGRHRRSSRRRLIPGNENAVFRVINGLTRWGARVVHKGNALVHVSGHAPAGELLYVLNIDAAAQLHAGPRRVAAPARARRARPR